MTPYMDYTADMSTPDLNLLITLDVLLGELSVARAARRLGLSPSAMSRALARLREATGDPLLVRAGRGLVPTPRALELRERVSELVPEVTAVLSPTERLDPAKLDRTFTLRSSDGFVENFGPRLVAQVHAEAPGVRLRFLQKPDKDSRPLREGTVDLETGVVDEEMSPELRTSALFLDRFVGVARRDHPFAPRRPTLARYLSSRHVSVSRRGEEQGMIEALLEPLGHRREIATVVGGFGAAIALARNSDLIATVPERHTENLRDGLWSFQLPFVSPTFTVSLIWHPRMEADAAHRWLRACVRAVCGQRGV